MASLGGSEHQHRQPPDFSIYALHSTGGRFDFETYEIDSGFVDDPIFVFHEMEHNGFVRGTIFGWVQHTAEFLHRDAGSRDLASFKWTLWQASEETHERGATFCSIKAFPLDQHRGLINALPDSYRGLYEDMAAVVDQVFTSSYMQYALGKAITNHALNPRLQTLLGKLQDSTQLRDLRLPDDYTPDMRWHRIIDAISIVGLSEFARRTYVITETHRERIGLALNGPVNDEETWSALSLGDATALDGCVSRALRAVLREMAASVDTIEPERFEDAQREATATLGRLMGRSVALQQGTKSETAAILANLKAGIRNDQIVDTGRIYKLPSGDLSRYWFSGGGPRKAVSIRNIDELDGSEWLVELTAGEVTGLARASYEDYREVLAIRRQLALAGSPIPELSTMIRLDDPRQFVDVYNQLAPFFVVELKGGFLADLASRNLHWYMAGDLREWWRELRQYRPMRYLPIVPLPAAMLKNASPVQSKEDAIRSRESIEGRSLGDPAYFPMQGGRNLIICEFDRLAGRFVRALPSYAITSFDDMVGNEFELFALSDREAIFENVWSLFNIAGQIWESH
jgi:hypothetical protein